MKPILRLAAAASLLIALSAAASRAQHTRSALAEKPDKDDILVRVDTDLVAVDVTVTDVKGKYLLDLQAGDFELLEDGVSRPIEFFQPVRKIENSPLALVIALDLSGSLSTEETVLQRQSIDKFIQMLDPNSICALLGFNYRIDILQDFTNDRKKLSRALSKIDDYGGSTRIYDALDRAVTMFKKAPLARGGKRLRRVIVVVTDGFDSASIIDKKELVRRANASGAIVYSITIPSFAPSITKNSPQKRLPTLLDIARIIDSTGGRDFPVESNDFESVFAAIAQELASGYTLAYHLPKEKRAAGVHKLQVKVKRPGALIRASRDSYVAE